MRNLHVVLLGAGGQLGRTLAGSWQSDARLTALSREQLDISDASAVSETLEALQPDLLINAAAYTRVDRAEEERQQAFQVNRDGAANVAHWAAANNRRLIHLSTDFVFNGDASRPCKPGDRAAPVSVYGESKLAGELAVLNAHTAGSVIVRTSWLYSCYPHNFVTTMLRLMTERERLQIVADQVGTPTSTLSLSKLLHSIMHSKHDCGIYHWSDAGVASWYDFAVAIQEEAMRAGILSRAIPIVPISTEQYPTPARRPSFSVLDKTASYADFNMPAIHWRTELIRVIETLSNKKVEPAT